MIRFALSAGLALVLGWTGAGAGEPQLAVAAEQGEAERAGILLESGAEVDGSQVDGMTALLWAAYHDDLEMGRLLVKARADVNQANRYGVRPLSLACQNGNAGFAALLLEAGADPNATLAGGETALMTAARTGVADVVKVLLERGARVDARERRGQTALMWAAAEGHLEVVDLLLGAGADFRTPLASGFTPLLFAVREGRAGVVGRLLEAGAGVNRAARPERRAGRGIRGGTTPLSLAVENGHFELAIALVEAGADPDDQRSGFAALHTVTWVRKTGFGDNEAGNPPPAGSGSIGSLDFVRKMVSLGAEVNVPVRKGSGGRGRMNTTGATPFLLGAKNADLPFLKLLVELGADPGIPNADGCTPLMAAAGIGCLAPGEEAGTEEEAMETVRWLLAQGADLNHVDRNGETAMHGAAYKSLPGMVRLLDEKGADLEIWNRRNKYGWTPLVIAQGFRPGNFKPAHETIEAISTVMRSHGVEPPPP
ncbi:MAG: hypothetical protein GWO24_06725, partial [Akkermansiaceae bacterium]|nr:hypothetical protein [Akkermansiaceae bacterium]